MKHKNFSSHIKLSKEILTFQDIKIEKDKFYRNKTTIFLRDIQKVSVFNKIPFGEKTCIMIIKSSRYI